MFYIYTSLQHQQYIRQAMEAKNLTMLLKTGCIAITPDFQEVICGSIYSDFNKSFQAVGQSQTIGT